MTTPGVTFFDHTADVGMDVEAEGLAELFAQAARGMHALLAGTEEEEEEQEQEDDGSVVRTLELEAEDGAALLVAWLRELLFLHDAGGLEPDSVRFDTLTDRRVVARIRTRPAARAVREIKGVTYHDMGLRRTDGRWRARVIFDV